ncbi:hypothetical protein [Lactobacillus taiwanensis]|uniref:hypothetical protein n=1 Tax=Lactobacillus taiwanensis TaxID=508451 RepID=UPI00322053C2
MEEDVVMKVKKTLICLTTAALSVYYNWGVYAFFVLVGVCGLIFTYCDAKENG